MTFYSDTRWSEGRTYQCANPAITVAKTNSDLQQIGRLRYSLFIERDGKSYPEAHRGERCFIEPVDVDSLNFMASAEGGCIAACRVTKSDAALKDRYLSRIIQQSGLAPEALERAVVCSRFSIAPTWKAKRLSVALLKEGYRAIYRHGMQTILLASRPSLAPYYAKFGFHETGRRYVEGLAGELVVQQLRVHDRTNLESCGSVLLIDHDHLQMNEGLEHSHERSS